MALQHDTDGFLIGDSTQLNEQVELLESIRDDIKAIRAALNGISANAVEALLRHATQVSETSQNAATHNAPNNTIINHYAGAVSTVTQSHKTENKTGDAYVNENNTHTNTAIEQSRTVRERKQIATSTRLRDSRGRFIAGNQAGSQIATDERVARLKADNPDTLPARSAANGRGVINNRVENKSSKLSESVSAPHTELSTTRINSSNRTGDHHTAVLTQALERMGHVVENFGESQNQHTRTSTSLQANQTNQHATLNVGEQSSVQHSDSSIDSNQNTQNSNTRNQSEQNSTARTNAPTPPAPSTVINQNDSTNNQDTAPPTQPRDQRGRFNAKQNRQEPVAGVRQRDSNGRFISADTPGGEAGFISRLSGGIGKQFKKANNGDVAIDEKIDPIISVGKELKDLADPLLSVGKFAMKATAGGIKTVAGVVKKHRNDSRDQTNDTAPPLPPVVDSTVINQNDSTNNQDTAPPVPPVVDSTVINQSNSDTVTPTPRRRQQRTRQRRAYDTNLATVEVNRDSSRNDTQVNHAGDVVSQAHDTAATPNQENNNQSTHALNSFNNETTQQNSDTNINHDYAPASTYQTHAKVETVNQPATISNTAAQNQSATHNNYTENDTATVNTPTVVLESANPTPTIDSLNVDLPTTTVRHGAIQLNSTQNNAQTTAEPSTNNMGNRANTSLSTQNQSENNAQTSNRLQDTAINAPVNATHSTNNSTITSSDTQNIEQSQQIENQTPVSPKRLRDERGRFVSQRITRDPVAEPTRNQINGKPVSSQAEPQAEHAKTSERGFAPAQRSSEARESKKFFREFSSYRKEQSVFDKAAKKLLRDISERESSSSEASNSGFMAGLIGGLMPMLLSVFTSLGAGIIAVFSGLGGLLLSGITGVLGVIFSPIALGIAAAASLAWGLFTEDGQKFFAGIGQWLTEKFNGAIELFATTFPETTQAIKDSWDAAVSLFSDTWKVVTDKADKVFSWFSDTWQGITDTVSGIFDSFATFLKDKFGIDIPKIVKTVVQPVIDSVSTAVKPVTDAASAVIDGAKELGDKAVSSIKEAVVNVKDNSINKAYESVKSSVKNGTVLTDTGQAISNSASVAGGVIGGIKDVVTGKSSDRKNALITEMNNQGITDKKERAMLMAQADVESGGFKYGKELGNDAYFDKYDAGTKIGKNLGNTEKGDGAKYKGRGSIQLTGRANYTAASKDLGVDLVNHPELAEAPEMAAKTALWFWKKNKKISTAAKEGNVTSVTHKVNGGENHLAERKDKYAKYLAQANNEELNAKVAKGENPTDTQGELPKEQTALANAADTVTHTLEKLSPISTASANETPYQAPKTTVTGQQNKSLLSQQEPAKHIVFNVASSDSVTTSNHAPVTTNTAQNQANQQQSLANKTASSNNQITNANLALESYAKTGIFNQTVNSNQSTAAQSDLTNQFVSDIANGKLEQDGKVKYVSDNSSLDAKLNELKQNEAKVINTKHNTDSNLTAIAPAVSPKSDIAATLVKQTSSDSFSRLLNTASPINIATAMSALPKIPAIPTIADAPSVSMPANLPIKPPISVNFPTAEVGQNLSDNRLAHIVSGGYSRLQN